MAVKILSYSGNVECECENCYHDDTYYAGALCGWMYWTTIAVTILDMIIYLVYIVCVPFCWPNKEIPASATNISGSAEVKQNFSSNTAAVVSTIKTKPSYSFPPKTSNFNSSSNVVGIDFGTNQFPTKRDALHDNHFECENAMK